MEPNLKTRYPNIICDLVIQEESCNLSCSYCLTGQSSYKNEHQSLHIFNSPRPESYTPGSDLFNRLNTLIENFVSQNIPVIKISGGEIFLIKGIMSFIEKLSTHFEKVIILTNGLLLTPNKLASLRNLGNIVLEFSIDSTHYEGNKYRAPSEQVHNKIIERLQLAIASNIPLEIYLVLNNRSIITLKDSLTDLQSYGAKNLIVFPFPVRGPNRKDFLISSDQYDLLSCIRAGKTKFIDILPGEAYLRRLEQFVFSGRQFRCYLPLVTFSAFDDGEITSCPNIWFDHGGNLLKDNGNDVFDNLSSSPFQKLLLSPHPRLEACRTCFSPWDMLSLYFNNEISLDDLCSIPPYSGKITRAQIEHAYNISHDNR